MRTAEADEDDESMDKPSIRPMNRPRQRAAESRTTLEKRFPALRRRRRVRP